MQLGEQLLALLVLVGVRHLGDVQRAAVTYAASPAGLAAYCRCVTAW
ncbi:hypothetical protein [Streptomyces asiaticus]